jgi:hypothetical protein
MLKTQNYVKEMVRFSSILLCRQEMEGYISYHGNQPLLPCLLCLLLDFMLHLPNIIYFLIMDSWNYKYMLCTYVCTANYVTHLRLGSPAYREGRDNLNLQSVPRKVLHLLTHLSFNVRVDESLLTT